MITQRMKNKTCPLHEVGNKLLHMAAVALKATHIHGLQINITDDASDCRRESCGWWNQSTEECGMTGKRGF